MMFNRYEVKARMAKDKKPMLGDLVQVFTFKKFAFNWANDLNRTHRLIYGHSDIEYYVFDTKLKQELCMCSDTSCTYVRSHG
ncbi:hypothetical protein FDI69_gp132 [Rhodococcus phage Trina]|uniref:Uncharacterized protein n=1 Tax=Rhodococcus phage Trina TaxID=2027905 RepID=A0A2D0ZWX1_9CAUD|nr:hypothetical protein FDI69_gp132 [Rhodococcus phage Trina]ASZ75053.1 hypothetical protein SEA_TRINA_275 [Rhodococcus phage Trina]